MSKYDSLLQPLFCQWTGAGDSEVCGESFTSTRLFTDHVRVRHATQSQLTFAGEGFVKHGVVCGWKRCEQTIFCTSLKDYITHTLVHPYHSFLKLLGAEFQEKYNLQTCLYETDFAAVVHPLEVELQCLWDAGKCGQVFDDVWEFYSHVSFHIKNGDTQNKCQWAGCKFCGRDKNKVLEHCRSHLQEKQIACPNCGGRFSNNTKLKDHLSRQIHPTDDPELTCHICHKSFPTARLLRQHTSKHISTIKCPHCEFTCQGPSRLLQHIRYRHDCSKTHQCPLCSKTYKTTQSLSVHLETHGEFSAMCRWTNCTYLAKSERSLRAHEKSVHQSDSMSMLFCCHVCSARFNRGHELTLHLKKMHGFKLPPGHCRFRYVAGKDGFKRLQTIRLEIENIFTPDVNTFMASNHMTQSDHSDQESDPSGLL